ncbi:MAG: hypothetical protein ACR2PR_08030 [Pseudohongiellaceae bacterium]
MSEQSTTQPSQVATEEAVRPADEHVTTSDAPSETSQAADDTQTPAASDAKSDQTTDTTATSDDKGKKAQPAKKDTRSERRIKQLNTTVGELRTRDAANTQTISKMQAQIDRLEAGQNAAPEPELKDFDDPKAYAKAYTKWEADQKPAASDDTVSRPGDEARDPTKHASDDSAQLGLVDDEVKSFRERGAEKLGDEFQEALESDGVAVDQNMGEFMMDSDFGPEIYVHLANNPDESKKIFDSSARRQMSALEDLEAKAKKGELDVGDDGQVVTSDDDTSDAGDQDAGGKKTTQSRTATRTTQAKEPPSDTTDSGSSSLEPDPENESMDDYAARRARETRQRAGLPT